MKVTSYIETNFNKLFWFLSASVFILIALRAFFIPFSHDETLTFFTYIQTGDYLPYQAHIDANNHVLNSLLANLCYRLVGPHLFFLRLPNVLAFGLLCLGVFKHFKYLKSIYSKIILVTFFILTLNFLDFFELCRGYGLSFGFVILGLAYLMEYFSSKKTKHFILFSLCLQTALVANLILLVLLIVFIFFIFIFQIRNKLHTKASILIIHSIHIAILIFWIKFSFFYKEHNSFYTGAGDSYWEVTFKSLMLLFFWTDRLWMQITVICFFIFISVFYLKTFFQQSISIDKIFTPQLFYTLTLIILLVAFYVQKKLLDINFPENRTAIFFYLLFILSFSFTLDTIPQKISSKLSMMLLIPSVIFFVSNYTVYNFSFWFYKSIPKSFYSILKEEDKKSKSRITIGGNLWKGLPYTFLNYENGSTLTNINSIYQMTMNCDYYIAMKSEKIYYKYFYDEIASENIWDMVLLKRKEKIQRCELYKTSEIKKNYKGNDEFFNFFVMKDSILETKNCIEANLEIKFNNVPSPTCANIVLQVNTKKGDVVYYKAITLNWLADDLNGRTKRIKLITGKLPANTDYIVVYLWNPKRVEMDFIANEVTITELKSKGVNFMIPESYYKYLEKTNSQQF